MFVIDVAFATVGYLLSVLRDRRRVRNGLWLFFAILALLVALAGVVLGVRANRRTVSS